VEQRAVPATVLIIENDRALRERIAAHFRQAGFQVFTAENTLIAGHSLVGHAPDAILVGADLPGREQLLDEMRAERETRAIPVIVVRERQAIERIERELRSRLASGK
jgi:DNA-binding response OmpR family regulator